MLRVELTASDLGRVHLADRPMPLIELGSLIREGQRRRRMPDLRSLVSPDGWRIIYGLLARACSPGFVVPPVPDPGAAIDQVMAEPRARLIEQFEYNARVGHPLPPWVYELSGTGWRATRLRQVLGEALRRVVQIAIAPMLGRFGPYAQACRTKVSTTLVAHGSGAALNTLHPQIRYRAPVLEIGLASGADIEVQSTGTGILLVPTASPGPIFTTDTTGQAPAVLCYPVAMHPLSHAAMLAGRESASARALALLLGSTRAAVLETIAHRSGCSTRELARIVGVSPASASEHATVLRTSGLVRTERTRSAAAHFVTDLGRDLLIGGALAALANCAHGRSSHMSKGAAGEAAPCRCPQ